MNTEVNSLVFAEEDDTDFSCDKYCNNECEFYKYCYANHEFCIKQIFKEIFSNTLSPRESKVIKMFYGWNGNRRYTFEEISKEFNLTKERIRQIYDKSMRKICYKKHDVALKELLYEIYSYKTESFYYEFLTDVLGEPEGILRFGLHTGVDISILDTNKQIYKTITEIKKELNTNIIDIEELQPYFESLDGIKSLNQLLHTSNSKLLFEYFNNDVMYFGLLSALSSIGYKIKGSDDSKFFDLMFVEKIKTLAIDGEIYKETLNELPLTICMMLFEQHIVTTGDLLSKFSRLDYNEKFSREAKEQIEDFLINKGLIVVNNERKIPLTNDFWNGYLKKLVVWLRENSYSILTLLAKLEETGNIVNNSFLEYIKKQYPKFDFCQLTISKETLIDELDLSVRSFNCLKRAGLTTVGEVVSFLESGGIVRNLGRKGIEETITKLTELGFCLNC